MKVGERGFLLTLARALACLSLSLLLQACDSAPASTVGASPAPAPVVATPQPKPPKGPGLFETEMTLTVTPSNATITVKQYDNPDKGETKHGPTATFIVPKWARLTVTAEASGWASKTYDLTEPYNQYELVLDERLSGPGPSTQPTNQVIQYVTNISPNISPTINPNISPTINGGQSAQGQTTPPAPQPAPKLVSDAFAAPAAPPTHAVSRISAPPNHRYAIVMGICQCRDSHIPKIDYAERDAQSFYDYLVAADGGRYAPTDVLELLGQEVTYAGMRGALVDWTGAHVHSGDMLTIYFAGHGTPDAPDSKNLYLVTYDTDYNKIDSSAYPMRYIKDAIQNDIHAQNVLVIVDACHSGGVGAAFDDKSRAIGIAPARINEMTQEQISAGPNTIVFTSAGSDQVAKESSELDGGHGLFTAYLLRGLRGEAAPAKGQPVPFTNLVLYVQRKVRDDTHELQIPDISGSLDPTLKIANDPPPGGE